MSRYNNTLAPDDVADLRGALRSLFQKLEELLPEEPEIVGDAVASFDRSCCRLRSAGIQLQREVKARLDDEREASGGQVVKRRVPRVMKALSEVGEGERLLRRATAAMNAGPHTYARFIERARAELAAI